MVYENMGFGNKGKDWNGLNRLTKMAHKYYYLLNKIYSSQKTILKKRKSWKTNLFFYLFIKIFIEIFIRCMIL